MKKKFDPKEIVWRSIHKTLTGPEGEHHSVPKYIVRERAREDFPMMLGNDLFDMVLKDKMDDEQVENFTRGSRRKGRVVYLRLVDRRPGSVTPEDLEVLRSWTWKNLRTNNEGHQSRRGAL